jgi:CelD/BcsL family acetyltransferase involved in cellulose biosynthesis
MTSAIIKAAQEFAQPRSISFVPSLANNGWSLQLITTEEEFSSLEIVWTELLRNVDRTVFQTYEWHRAWWHWFGKKEKSARLCVVVVRHGAEIVAIAPWYTDVSSLGMFMKTRRLLFMGRGTSDYLDIIVKDNWHGDVYARLADYLFQEKEHWELLLLEDIPNRSLTHQFFHSALACRGLVGQSTITDQCPMLLLPGTWDAYYASLSNQFQRELRRKTKNLHATFQCDFERIDERGDIAAAMDDFIALHQHRWEQRGERGVFAQRELVAFHKEVAAGLSARRKLRLNFLRINGRRVAGSYGFVCRDTHFVYLLGLGDAGEAMRFSPGSILLCYVIQQAIEEGCVAFDLMRGIEAFKYQLGAVNEPNRTLTIYSKKPQDVEYERRKHSLNLLIRSFRRRVQKEITALQSVVYNHGVFSRSSIRYIARRSGVLIVDARKKINSPDKPLYID